MMREGWRSIPDLPVEIATQCDPSINAHVTVLSHGRAIVYDVGDEWYRIFVTRDNNVYYQRWSTLRD